MDLATLTGLVVSLGLVGYAIFLGGNLAGFADTHAIFIVVLGTLFVTLTSFSGAEVGRTGLVILKAFFHNTANPTDEAVRLLKLAQKARQNGLLGIQKEAAAEQTPFLRQALVLAVDGTTPDNIERVLYADTAGMLERHGVGMQVLRKAAETGPAMGLIGTLIGLVQMLGQLSDPDKIGPSMAVAILATFYGAVLSYMIFNPLATKLERVSAAELLLRKLYSAGVLSIARQENPRQLELQLNAILPPAQRVSVFRG
ncbi:MAG: MotA/TolQ/ExbB proton channel family protein [Alphaproteobacteria bacterium]